MAAMPPAVFVASVIIGFGDLLTVCSESMYCARFSWKAETAYGINDNNNVIGYLVEADYTPPRSQNWEFEAQLQSFMNDLGKHRTDDSTLSAGLTYKLTQAITLRAVLQHDLNIYHQERDTRGLVQFYYYGK